MALRVVRVQLCIDTFAGLDEILTGCLLVEHTALRLCTANSRRHSPIAQHIADLDGGFDGSSRRMKENRKVSPVQPCDEIAKALRGPVIEYSDSRDPFVAATPAGIRRAFGDEKSHGAPVDLRH